MKKYLMTGMAALTLCAAFTSCNKNENLFDPYAKGEAAKADYKKNFSEIVGEINPNQDWKLLGDMTAEVSVNLGIAQAYTVAIYNDNPNTNKEASLLGIAENVAEGATVTIKFTGELAKTLYYVGVFNQANGRGIVKAVSTENNKITAQIGTAKTKTRATESEWPSYAKSMSDFLSWSTSEMQGWTALTNEVLTDPTNGNHTLNDKQYTGDESAGDWHWIGNGDGAHYRIPAGTTVTEPWSVGAGTALDAVVVYVEGTVVITPENNLNAVTLVVANGGEIQLKGTNNMSTSGRFVVAAGGKITGESGAVLSINNAGACYNAGEINYNGTLRVNGSEFYNNNTINVDILTGTSGGTNITNFGHITARTNMMAGETYNGIYTNACHLEFTGDAGIGSLTLLNNSRVDVGGKLQTSGTVTMYDMSEINCGDLHVQQTSFKGEGNFSVVVVNKDIYCGYAGDLTLSGNIYFDWEKQNTGLYVNGTWSNLDNEWSVLGGIKKNIANFTTEATTPIAIPAGSCTGGGYGDEGLPPVVISENPQYCSIAFEDLGSTFDLDFNDIVVYVAYYAKSQKTTAQIVCAGGTLPVDLLYNGEVIDSKSGGINHNYKGKVCPINTPCDVTKFQIKVVDGESSTIVDSYTVQGSAPQALVIPNKWQWPGELQNITEVYPTFAGWVSSDGALNWYE